MSDFWKSVENWLLSDTTLQEYMLRSYQKSLLQYQEDCLWLVKEFSSKIVDKINNNVISLRRNNVCIVIDNKNHEDIFVSLEFFDEETIGFIEVRHQLFTKDGEMIE